MAAGAMVGSVLSTFEDHKICIRAFWYRDHAETGAARPIGAWTINLVHLVLRWVNGTRKPIALSITHNLDPPRWHLVPKWSRRFEVNGIPGELDECLAAMVRVRPRNIR